MGNIIDSNLGFATLASNALLNTDTTPATFWITNPNNTVTNNIAAGEAGAGGLWMACLCTGQVTCGTITRLLHGTAKL